MQAKHCKVITTCFAGRSVRQVTTLCGDPPGPFLHAQVFPDAEAVLRLVRLLHELERQVDPGVPCDTLVVNNDAGWEKGNRFLREIDGTRTRTGVLRVLTRKNYGSSLGGYDHAFRHFRDRYEYWTFTEDDILLTGEGYFARCVEAFEREAGTGFVAIQGLSRAPLLHAHGGVGTTHRDILDGVVALWGHLPHRRAHESQEDDDHAVLGEVLFTNLIERLGFRLRTLDAPPVHAFAYEYMRMHGLLPPAAPLLPRLLRRAVRITNRLAGRAK